MWPVCVYIMMVVVRAVNGRQKEKEGGGVKYDTHLLL